MFKSDPGLIPIPQKPDLWFLDKPLVWEQAGLTITIPVGFISDDASIPKFLDWIPFLDRQGLSRRPGLLHDGIYSIGRHIGKDGADRILRAACLVEGMLPWQAWCIYQGVHLGGQSSWDSDAREGNTNAVDTGDFVTAALFEELTGSKGDPYQTWLDSGVSIYRNTP